MLIEKITCYGDYCDNMRIECNELREGYTVDDTQVAETDWTTRDNRKDCPDGYFVSGMGCLELDCSQVKLHCKQIKYEISDITGDANTVREFYKAPQPPVA